MGIRNHRQGIVFLYSLLHFSVGVITDATICGAGTAGLSARKLKGGVSRSDELAEPNSIRRSVTQRRLQQKHT